MFNFFKKYLLILIFFGALPSIYAMENSQKYRWPLNALAGLWSKMPSIPSTLGSWKIRKEADIEKPKNTNHEFPIANANNEILQILQTDLNNGWCLNVKQNWKKIETYLAQETDINLKTDKDKLSLLLLVALTHEKPDINIIKNLIKQGADVNKYRFDDKALAQIDNHWAKMSGYTALAQAIDTSLNTEDFQIIQELCNAGASITDINNSGQTALHRMAALGLPKKAFEIVLTHAYPEKISQIIVKTKNTFSFVDNRIAWLKEILQKTNKYGKTAAQVLSETCHKADQDYKNEILPLLDGSQLDKDYTYLAENPEINQEAKKNLAWQIYNNVTIQLSSLNSQKQEQNIRIASGGLDEISRKANVEIINIIESALKKNGRLKQEDFTKIKECLLHGADLNLKIKDKALFHLAALYQNEELFNYLQSQKADGTILDKNGNTPFDIKMQMKNL